MPFLRADTCYETDCNLYCWWSQWMSLFLFLFLSCLHRLELFLSLDHLQTVLLLPFKLISQTSLVSQIQGGSCNLTLGLVVSLEERVSQFVFKEEGGVENLGKPFFFSSWTADASSCCYAEALWIISLHHVTSLSAFRGLYSADRLLLLRGKVSGGVEDAASDGGDRDPGQKRSPLAALLPRSSGEAQLPQRSHLRVVGSPAWTLPARPGCLYKAFIRL